MLSPLASDEGFAMGTMMKCVSQDKQAIILAVEAKNLLQESLATHHALPPAMYHLGQAQMAALLLGALPDSQDLERLELQWQASGPFGNLYAESRGIGKVRGTISNPAPNLETLHVPLGQGLVQIRKVSKLTTTGIVSSKGNVVDDVLELLERSEQKLCAMNLWVELGWSEKTSHPFEVKNALGFLVHVLPANTPQETDQNLFRWNTHLKSLGGISEWVLGEDNKVKNILSFITGEYAPRIVFEGGVNHFCTCSSDRAKFALDVFEASEKESKADESINRNKSSHQILTCEFCGKKYEMKNPQNV